MDGASPRASVFDSALRFARQIQLPAPFLGAVVIAWPRAMGNSRVSTPSTVGLPLHLVDFSKPDALLLRSFGPGDGAYRPRAEIHNEQTLARLSHTEIASADMYAYRVHVWTEGGALLRKFDRRPTWFNDSTRTGIGNHNDAPPSAITAIERASDSTLWIAVRLPSPHWKRAWSKVPMGQREVTSADVDLGALFRTRLDLVDVRRGVLLASTDVNGLVISALGDSMFAVFSSTEIAGSRLSIERVEVVIRK